MLIYIFKYQIGLEISDSDIIFQFKQMLNAYFIVVYLIFSNYKFLIVMKLDFKLKLS